MLIETRYRKCQRNDGRTLHFRWW